ncbi:YraN family protein [Geitlerinema sp. PCC 9228]|jgi:putative endonuclease|uniref:YraN family protein n=1 Tax=Geitlerinema sp. PCC 9228 TaxID=111611 RepID=UPI0008F9E24F|nr:YraN family protein [Geitlerinema sp. PCC 9228]
MKQPADKQPANHQAGELGETLVATWLQQQQWRILDRRWRCRWGEIDIIAQYNNNQTNAPIAFVEVKTRRGNNWDAGGRLAVTPSKQNKLQKAASLFLAENPHLSENPCRFDVALVRCCRLTARSHPGSTHPPPDTAIIVGNPIYLENHQLVLEAYIESAFLPLA